MGRPATLDLIGDAAIVHGDTTWAHPIWFPDMTEVPQGSAAVRPSNPGDGDLYFVVENVTLYQGAGGRWVPVAADVDAWKALLDGRDLSGQTFAAQIRRFSSDPTREWPFVIDNSEQATGTVILRPGDWAHAWSSLPVGKLGWDLQDTTGGVTTEAGGVIEVLADWTR